MLKNKLICAPALLFVFFALVCFMGCREDAASLLKNKTLQAEAGVVEAQFDLGMMYDLGRNTKQDHVEALKWYTMAAEQGHANAQYNLGRMYDWGRGMPVDYVMAYKWYDIAASRNDAVSDVARRKRDFLKHKLSPEQIAEAERLSREFSFGR
ncbi:MAG: hypothetical protein PHU03_03220 [Syntrophales bacterium]|nr:hypothetical protein [Syntrophales bacterium]